MIVEPTGHGHRFYLVRLLIEEALRQGYEVALLTGTGQAIRQDIDRHLSDVLVDTKVIEFDKPTWRDIERIATGLGASLTVVPEADWWVPRIAARLGWRGPGRLGLLCMRDYPSRAQNPLRWVVATVAKVVSMVACTLAPRVRLCVLRSPLWSGRSVWRDCRDPVGLECSPEEVIALRQAWGLGDDRYWYGVVGALNTSKNIPLVTDAVLRFASERPLGVLLAGEVSDQVADEVAGCVDRLRAAGVQVVVVDRPLDRDEFDAAITAADCFVVAYSRDAPSGTFCKALAAGCRVVAAGASVLRDDCGKVPDNATWTPLELEPLANALSGAAGLPRPAPVQLAGEVEFARRLLK